MADPGAPVDICFVVRSLDLGGAERQLSLLTQQLANRGISVLVVPFYSGGQLEREMQEAGVPVHSLAKRKRVDLAALLRLVRILRSTKPRTVYSMLISANYACLAVRPLVRGPMFAWGMRDAGRNLAGASWSTTALQRAQVPLSRFVDIAIFNSAAGHAYYVSKGFRAKASAVIPNGIDTRTFLPGRAVAPALRAGWGLQPEALVYGIVGNLHPGKGHELFLSAAATVAASRPEARFVIVGTGPRDRVEWLRSHATDLGILAKVVFAGHRDDMVDVYNAIDIVVSASDHEGCSNSLLEAMSCGTPCVATDVGDSARIVDDVGAVAHGRTPEALADAMEGLANMLAEQGPRLRERARSRVLTHYGLEALTDDTLRVLGFASDG